MINNSPNKAPIKTVKSAKLLEEEIRFLRMQHNEVIKENLNLKNQLDDLKETTQNNKLLLDEFVSKITTHKDIVDSLTDQKANYQEKLRDQEQLIAQLNAEKMAFESTKIISTTSQGSTANTQQQTVSGNEYIACKGCGRILQLNHEEAKLHAQVSRLMTEFQIAKNELNKVKENFPNRKETKGSLLNMNSEVEDMLQKMLENAEEQNDLLFFIDKNNVAWELKKREDLNSAREEAENAMESSGSEVEKEEEKQ